MSIPVLLFADGVLPAGLKDSPLCIYHIISTQTWDALVQAARSLTDAEFILSCGASPHFVAFSQLWTQHGAQAMITIHEDVAHWIQRLTPLPYLIRRRWVQAASLDNVNDNIVHDCVMTGNNVSTRVLAAAQKAESERASEYGAWGSDQAMISVFTSTFHSGKTKLGRAVQSMLGQTFNNWEWVIVDDSKNDPDTRTLLKHLAMFDLRIKVYDLGHSGFIGEAKWRAANLCRGEWLVELDHDDRIDASLLDKIWQIGKLDPSIGVIYSDYYEVSVDAQEKEYYRLFACTTAFGAAGYASKFLRGKWHAWYMSPPMNHMTMTDIVGVPNHVRSFSAQLYHAVGGFNFSMPIADDYELMLRLFMSGAPWARIAEPLYAQYANAGADNFTDHRRKQIRALQAHVSEKYKDAYQKCYRAQCRAQHPTLLKDQENSNTGCWDLPGDSRLKLEYTWYNGRLFRPNRSLEAGSVIHQAMSKSNPSLVSESKKIVPVLSQLLKHSVMTIILLVNKGTEMSQVQKWLTALENVKQNVFVLGHPESILRILQSTALQNDPSPSISGIIQLLREFQVWCFGLDNVSCTNAFEKWKSEPQNIVQHHLANYGLKICTSTEYIMYADASQPISAAMASMLANADEEVLQSDELQQHVVPFGSINPIGSKNIMNGFFHHITIPELYGYWPLDGTDAAQLVRSWVKNTKALEKVVQSL